MTTKTELEKRIRAYREELERLEEIIRQERAEKSIYKANLEEKNVIIAEKTLIIQKTEAKYLDSQAQLSLLRDIIETLLRNTNASE